MYTLPFELFMHNRIKLYYNGNVEPTQTGDVHYSCILVDMACTQRGIAGYFLFTENQLAICFDFTRLKLEKFGKISVFGMLPPKLLTVFENTCHYFCYYYRHNDFLDYNTLCNTHFLSSSFVHSWVDLTHHRVMICMNDLSKVLELINDNLRVL